MEVSSTIDVPIIGLKKPVLKVSPRALTGAVHELGPRQVLSAMATSVEMTETVDKPERNDDYFHIEKQVFYQEKPIYIKEEHIDETPITNPLIASQGSGVITDENTPLNSDRVANCFALVLENVISHKTALFHIDANSPRAIDVDLLNQISEGGGLVVMQAIRGSQSIPSEETKRMFSEYILANVLIAGDIQVDTGSRFWDITYLPDKHEFRIHPDETANTFGYTRESQLSSVPEMISLTDEQKIVATIINDQNIHSYLRQSGVTSSEKILASVNTLATFISKDINKWVDRWVLSSKDEKQIMASQIAQNLTIK